MEIDNKAMKSNAGGQLLGYSIQYPRALYHLMKCSDGDSVCIECLGDVATVGSDDHVIAEEAKSSISGNPLTNRSSDLWKTFYNWIQAINDQVLDVNKTKFIIYCNAKGRNGLVNDLHNAQSSQEVELVLDKIKTELVDIENGHEIWPYYSFVIQHESIFKRIISSFELQLGICAGYEELYSELKRIHVPAGQVEFLAEQMSGWILKEVATRIAAKGNAILSWKEFNFQFSVLFQRIRQRDLIDYTFSKKPSIEDVQGQVQSKPLYIQQLEILDQDEEEIIEAINEFLRANTNRLKWIEEGVIDELSAIDFESRLKYFWKNEKDRIRLTGSHLDEKIRGRLLLSSCKIRQEHLRNLQPPHPTIPGTYHALANVDDGIGWHPNWENEIVKKRK